jgi:predicted RND superfamily exporter protein
MVVTLLALTVFLSFHTEGLDLDNTLSAWFPENDPNYLTYEEFRDDFTGNRNLIILIKAPDIFTPRILEYISEKTEAIEEIDFVTRVYSLSTANRVYGSEEGIEVKPLLHGLNAGKLPEIRDYALADELFRNDLVSSDGTLTTMLIIFDEEKADPERGRLLEEIREIMDGDKIDETDVFYSGSMEISKEYDRFTMENQRDFTPPLIVLIIISILFLFRSFSKLFIVGFVVAVSLVWTVGFYSLLGFSFNVISGMLIPLIVILSISDSIHILEYHDEVSRTKKDGGERFIGTLSYITYPCLATSLTTSFGLLSLATSKVPAVRTFGIGAAIGITSAFIVSIVFVPFLLSIVPARFRKFKKSFWLGPLELLHNFNQRRAKPLLILMISVTVLAIGGINRLEVNTNQMDFFDEESQIRQAGNLLNKRMSGVFSVELYLKGEEGSMKEPEVLRAMEHFSERLLELPHVKKVSSLADQVKRINRELQDSDPAEYRIPDSRELVAQELFLLSLSDRGRNDLLNIVASDYSRGRISIRMDDMSSDELVDICRLIDSEAGDIFAGTGVIPILTGGGQLFSNLDRYLVESQIRSFTLAFITITIFMFIFFRSWKYGFLSILPNLFPIVIVMGIMGIVGITLNVATVTVASVALGIAADDTIHFISRFKRERRTIGRGRVESLKNATKHSGRAIVSTSLINALGFSILVFSDFMPTVYFGSLVALTMIFALVGDLVYLPANLLAFHKKEKPG